jgi:hypothetical protein
MLVRLRGRKPTQIANTESVWPHRTITLEPRSATPFTDEDADTVLEAWARTGLVEQQPGQSFEDALLDAKSQRMSWLDFFINNFREENARRRAASEGILMPRKIHRDALKELKALQDELSSIDAELLGEPAKQVLNRQTVEDVAAKELLGFGISPAVAPLIPDGAPLTDTGV